MRASTEGKAWKIAVLVFWLAGMVVQIFPSLAGIAVVLLSFPAGYAAGTVFYELRG